MEFNQIHRAMRYSTGVQFDPILLYYKSYFYVSSIFRYYTWRNFQKRLRPQCFDQKIELASSCSKVCSSFNEEIEEKKSSGIYYCIFRYQSSRKEMVLSPRQCVFSILQPPYSPDLVLKEHLDDIKTKGIAEHPRQGFQDYLLKRKHRLEKYVNRSEKYLTLQKEQY